MGTIVDTSKRYLGMPLSRILSQLLVRNEPLIQRLSESYPIKRAAQLTVYAFLKGKNIGSRTMKEIESSPAAQRLQQDASEKITQAMRFKETKTEEARKFYKDIRKSTEEMKKKILKNE